MLKVNNKRAIRELAICSFEANKMRNIFAAVAIILTTVLFTSLFTIVDSLLTSVEESTMRQVGTSSHGAFKYLTMEQYNKLKTHPSIESISYSVILGIAENKELAKHPSEIRYASNETGAEKDFAIPTTGRLPQNVDEIALDTIVLEQLGIPAELGQNITLEYSLGDEKKADTFTLVGYWQGDILTSASLIWLNQSYVEKQLENYLPLSTDDLIGTINANVDFSNSFNIEGKLLKVLADCGYTVNEIPIGVNWAYTGNNGSADIGTLMGGAAAILMIVFCGYLMISNVFYISIAKDIRFYGLLKTIGTTGRQIRALISRQALILCIMSIPLGLLFGYLVGAWMTPVALSIFNTNVITVSMSAIVFIASALFAIFTVFISIAKPLKIAAKVSPIEALRSTDGTSKSKNTFQNSQGINLWNMGRGNVFRNKKKTLLVTVSLSLSLIILNTAYSMANSFDMDQYLSGMIGSDFAVGNVSFFNLYLDYDSQDTLNANFLKELSAKNGIESMSNIYFSEPTVATDPRLMDFPDRAEREIGIEGNWLENMKKEVQSPVLVQHIYGIEENLLDRLTIFEGEIDYAKLQTGRYVISVPYIESENQQMNYYNVGDQVIITNVEGISKEYEVLAIASMPYNISSQHRHPVMPEYILASEIFLSDIDKKAPMLTTLDVADAYETEMEQFLSEYCQNTDPNMQYQSKEVFVAEYENIQRTYKSVGIILSSLVAFIGIMNFINTVITSIMSRKRELAMLQSIGMTNRQIQIMLIGEGLVYTVLTALFALTIGSVLGYLGVCALTGGGLYLRTYFTAIPSLLCLPALAVISILVPCISEKIMSKRSVVERLREVD